MRTRIYFLRHGECQSNINPLFSGKEDTLTEKGLAQAKGVALRFKDIPLENIYTSHILRARLTAGEIEKVVGIKPVIHEFLKERKGGFIRGSMYSPTESFEDFKPRLAEAKKFFENISHKHIAVVTHGVFLKSFAAYLMLGDSFSEKSAQGVVDTLSIENTSISKFVFNTEKSAWHIDSWNDHIHLS